MRYLPAVIVILATGGNAAAQRWQDATADCLGTTAQWSNKVDVADVDGDGQVDLLIANGGNYDTPGSPEPVRVWKNLGGWATAGSHCMEISAQAVLGFTGLSRVIRAVDLDGDKDVDLITGGAYQTQLKLFTRNAGTWTDASSQLPQQLTSIGDIKAGDVDGDGDLDLLLAEWGATLPGAGTYLGGRTRLYLNNGQGTFTEATTTHMPDILMKWSWDVELADVDNDFDLDALIACKLCTTSYLFTNDGTGHFTNAPNALPQFANNYDFEPMDIDADGDLDLITINDGPQIREHLLVNNGSGVFTDETATRLSGTANPANADDNAALWMDVDADGDADLLFATLGNDRLLINTAGVFTLAAGATPNDTPGSLGIAAADLDGDGRLDLLQGQGETAFADKVQLANAQFAVDTVPPSIRPERKLGSSNVGVIRARVHDHVGPSHVHDWQRVWVEHDGALARVFESAPLPSEMTDMVWMGEFLWASPPLDNVTSYRVCATDRRGNSACSDIVYVLGGGGGGTETGDIVDAGGGSTGGGGGCCDAGRRPGAAIVPFLVVLIVLARRRGRAATIKV